MRTAQLLDVLNDFSAVYCLLNKIIIIVEHMFRKIWKAGIEIAFYLGSNEVSK